MLSLGFPKYSVQLIDTGHIQTYFRHVFYRIDGFSDIPKDAFRCDMDDDMDNDGDVVVLEESVEETDASKKCGK